MCPFSACPPQAGCAAGGGKGQRSSLTYQEPLPFLPDSAGAVGCFLALESVGAEGCK